MTTQVECFLAQQRRFPSGEAALPLSQRAEQYSRPKKNPLQLLITQIGPYLYQAGRDGAYDWPDCRML